MSACKNPYGLKFVCIFVWLIYYNVQGQEQVLDKQLSLECSPCSIQQALKQIEQHIDYYFSYNTNLFEKRNSKIFLDVEDCKLRKILDTLISDTTIHYRVIEKQIVLYRHLSVATDTLKHSEDILIKKPVVISGRIIEKHNNEPVPFANIAIVGKSLGSVSNLNGEFILKVPPALVTDTIGISCIGFQTLILPIKEAGKLNIFEIETEYVPIQEVIIRNTDPLYLIRSALKKIPENYDDSPSLLTSFYRETITRGDHYLGITEAVLQTYKSGYSPGNDNDQIKIIKGRKTQNFERKDTITLKLKAGLNTTLLLDMIKNPADFLQENNFKYYDYRLSDIIIDNNNENYVIDFRQKANVTEPLYYGKIYIDIRNLAFTGFEFSLNQKGIEKAWNRFVIKKPSWLKVRPAKASYTVNYRKYGNTYFLNLVRVETEFKVRIRRQFFGSLYNSKIEMVVTQIDTTNVRRFRYREIANAESILNEEFKESTEKFWSNYNYIKPDEPLEKAIGRIINTSDDN